MSRTNKDEIIAAYDEAFDLLIHLEDQLDLAIAHFRTELLKARRAALEKAPAQAPGT